MKYQKKWNSCKSQSKKTQDGRKCKNRGKNSIIRKDKKNRLYKKKSLPTFQKIHRLVVRSFRYLLETRFE